MLLFIDNIFRFVQAGSEVSALMGRMPKNNDDALSQFVTPIVDSVYNFEGLENRLHDVVGYMDER